MGRARDESWMHRAEQAFARGDTSTANRLAEERLEAAPDDADALALLDDVAMLEEGAASVDAPASEAAGYTPDNFSPSHPASVPAPAAPEPPVRDDARVDAGSVPGAAERPAPPVGVIIVSVIYGFGALMAAGAALIGLVGIMGGEGAGLLLVLVGGVAACVSGAVARGLWRLQSWAWGVALALSVVSFIGNVTRPGETTAVLAAVTNVLVVAYLLVARGHFRAVDARSGEGDAGTAPP